MPLNELYNAIDPQGIILNSKVFGIESYPGEDPFKDSRGQFPDADKFGKTFITTAPTVQGGLNGVTSIDDPTYLGFSLRFDILSPLFNGATLGTPKNPQPLIFAAPVETIGPVEPSKPAGESAVGYLETIGEGTRANYLRAFIQGIQEVNTVRPYYWQTIEGLPEAWGKSFDMKDPYSGSAEGEGISIGCLEALDLKISALFNLYKAAVFDVKYKRTILPINLMYFNVYVDVYEIRKFKSVQNKLTQSNISNQNDTIKLINENTASITFSFNECIWDLTATSKVFDNVTNAGGNEMTTSSMKWVYCSIDMESQFPGFGSSFSDSANIQADSRSGNSSTAARSISKKILDNASGAIDKAARGTISNLKKGVVNKVKRTARSLIQNPLLGNVFGQRNQILAAIRNPQALINAVAGGVFQASQASTNLSTTSSLGDSVFAGQLTQVNNNLDSSNIFGGGPPGPPPLTSNNVFG